MHRACIVRSYKKWVPRYMFLIYIYIYIYIYISYFYTLVFSCSYTNLMIVQKHVTCLMYTKKCSRVRLWYSLLHGADLSWEADISSAVKKLGAFYETRRFIAAFTRARHLSLFWALDGDVADYPLVSWYISWNSSSRNFPHFRFTFSAVHTHPSQHLFPKHRNLCAC